MTRRVFYELVEITWLIHDRKFVMQEEGVEIAGETLAFMFQYSVVAADKKPIRIAPFDIRQCVIQNVEHIPRSLDPFGGFLDIAHMIEQRFAQHLDHIRAGITTET